MTVRGSKKCCTCSFVAPGQDRTAGARSRALQKMPCCHHPAWIKALIFALLGTFWLLKPLAPVGTNVVTITLRRVWLGQRRSGLLPWLAPTASASESANEGRWRRGRGRTGRLR